MLNLMVKRQGPMVATLRRHVVKRHVNINAASRSVSRHTDDPTPQNWAKRAGTNLPNEHRKYSTLPEPVAAPRPRPVFVSHEDAFAHAILERKEIYSTTIAKSFRLLSPKEISEGELEDYASRSWKALPVPDIVEAFAQMSNYAANNGENILDEKYAKFLRYLAANCRQFTDSEMGEVLRSLAVWPLTYTREDMRFKDLWSALDRDCLRRAPQWSFDQLLLFCDHWHGLRLTRWSEFIAYVMKKLASKSSRLSPANLVQYMFYANSSRSSPKDMYNLEYRMETCVDELDVDELAVVAMGFFKSKTPIRNSNLLNKIIQRTIRDIDTVDNISLSAILKIVRYSSMSQTDYGIMWELLVSTLPQIPRLSLKALIQIVTTSVKMRFFHPELLTSIAQRFNKDIKTARIKDMERLVLGLTCFNFTPDIRPNIYDTIIEELHSPDRVEELDRYQRSLANCLQYLGVMNYYPKDLIALVLDPQNLRRTYAAYPFNANQAILVIDLNIDVEVPDYTGPRLDSRSRSIIAKDNVNSSPLQSAGKLSARHNFFHEIMDTCEDIFGSRENLHIDWVLPHYKEADIIMCLDKNNLPLPVEPILSKIKLGNVKKRPEYAPEGSRWIALIIGAVNCYIRDTHNLLGKDAVKFRQLESIGYKPILIPWYEWYSSELNRKNYLKQKLFE